MLNNILFVVSKQTLFFPRHIHAEHFHCQCFGWLWFQLRLVSKNTNISAASWMTVFRFCGTASRCLRKHHVCDSIGLLYLYFSAFVVRGMVNTKAGQGILLLCHGLSRAVLRCEVFYVFQSGTPLDGRHKGVIYSEIYRCTVKLPWAMILFDKDKRCVSFTQVLGLHFNQHCNLKAKVMFLWVTWEKNSLVPLLWKLRFVL